VNLNLEALEPRFDLVATRGDEVMDVFYFRLFLAAPSVIQLFAETDIKRQKASPKHYPAVGAALLASIAEIADSAWTPECEQAWSEAFALVAGAMIEGAETARLEAAA
jgi:hemoglobin-like flavoprotein